MTGYTACEWPVSYASCQDDPVQGEGTGCSSIDQLPTELRQRVERMAIDLLWTWTGRKFGLCDVVLRPCREAAPARSSIYQGSGPYVRLNDGVAGAAGTGNWIPYMYQGQWYNAACGSCGSSCACALDDGIESINLHSPIDSIVEVRVDGQLLPSTVYRLMYGKYLVRIDGGRWPLRQDLTAPSDQPDTFEIIYRQGVQVPDGGQLAAGRLACELAKSICNDTTCELPERIQTITRQGVTVGFEDDFSSLAEGKVGIWMIDAWVQSVRPARSYAAVRSPDVSPRSRGVSWRG